MKTIFKRLIVAGIGVFLVGGVSCNNTNNTDTFDLNKKVIAYTRDTSSGTRDGFFTAIGFSEAKEDNEPLANHVEAKDNSNMISLVNNDMYGIGYISLASVKDSSLKALSYEGVAPSEGNVVNGSYTLSRNFNYIIRNESDCSETEWLLINGFLAFMNSQEGLAIIKSNDGILTSSIGSAKKWNDILNENASLKALCEDKNATKVTINLGGSTSVKKIAEALSKAFSNLCSAFEPLHNHTGSSDAYKGTQGSQKDNAANKLHIGFLSRELKKDGSENAAEKTSGLICKDGIVAVVNSKNTALDNITAEKLKMIYQTGASWSDVVA